MAEEYNNIHDDPMYRRVVFSNMKNNIFSLQDDLFANAGRAEHDSTINESDIIERYNSILEDAHALGFATDLKPLTIGSFEDMGGATAVNSIIERLYAEILLEYNKRAVVEAIEKLFNRLIAEDISDNEIKVAYTSISNATIEYKLGELPELKDDYVSKVGGFKRAAVYALYSALEYLKTGNETENLYIKEPNKDDFLVLGKLPDDITVTTSKVSQSVFAAKNSDLKIPVSSDDTYTDAIIGTYKGKPVINSVALYKKDDAVESALQKCLLRPFSGVIHDAIGSLSDHGIFESTPAYLLRYITDRDNMRTTQAECDEVTDLFSKMLDTGIVVDETAERQSRGEKVEQVRRIGRVIDGDIIEKYVKGKDGKLTKVTVLRWFKQPLLYEYSKDRKQIQPFKRELLHSPNRSYSSDFSVIQIYLIKRIKGMMNGNNSLASNRILFCNLYDLCDCGDDAEGKAQTLKNKRLSIRKDTFLILDGLKAKGDKSENEPLFQDYKKVTKGREIIGVDIIDKRIKTK